MATDPSNARRPSDASGDAALEEIVAEFLLEREEGRKPSIDDYLARHPKHAEALAQLLTYDTHPPARRDTSRSGGGRRDPGAARPAAPGASDAIRLGPYEVIEHVSTAGGGTVYRARHREAGHVVALKVLDARGAVDPRDIERFTREAAMLRALDLVHVVPVLDAGEDGGRFWIAMKWLEGDTFSKLREAVREKQHPLHDERERARLVSRVARTFAAIHGYGILHRDVKPTNIMVDRTGEPMIIDFGIAQAPDLPELTATTDQVMGTPRYLAPELLAGGNRQVSPRTDVYGLGLCLYELCTGAEAFKQAMRTDLFTAIRATGPLAPRKVNPGLSDDLAAVILRALELDPARRYPGMTTFADDLDRVARGEPPERTTLRGAHPLLRFFRRNRKRLVAAVCLAAVLIPALWLVTTRGVDEIRARDLEAQLRPFAFFAPEAFAGGHGLPPRSVAGALAANAAASADQRLLAAWIPLLTGDVGEARAHLGAEPLPGEGFAARILRDHVKALKAVTRQGHAPGTFLDADSRPVTNPVTGRAYEVLFSFDNQEGAVTRDPAGFDESVRLLSATTPPATDVDHLVLATLHWSLLPNDARVDSSARRSAIERELAEAVGSDRTRLPALHVRGALRFLAGDFAAARADFAQVVAAQPAAVGTRYLLGIACCRSGDPKAACAHLAVVERDLPPSHAGRNKMLAQMALARAAAGEVDPAVALCERWWTDPGPEPKWQDVVIPRVIAAHIRRAGGDLQGARALLGAAVEAEERLKLAQRERDERGSPHPPGPISLWKPAFDELIALAEALEDHEFADTLRMKMSGCLMKPIPATAEAYLELDLAGLRPIDARRTLSPLDPLVPKVQ